MGVNFERYTKHETEFYKIGVYAGYSANWRRCKACGKTIKAHTPIVGVHSFGEFPTFFHPECSRKVARAMVLANQSLNSGQATPAG